LTDTEKKLLKDLTTTKFNKSGKISIDVTNSYWVVSTDIAVPNVFSLTKINSPIQISPHTQYTPNCFLFGFNDYQSNFVNSRRLFAEFIAETQDIRQTGQRNYDDNYFFVISDKLVQFIDYSLNFNGLTDIKIPINSFSLPSYTKGDLIIIRYTENRILGGITKDFYIVETLIHCRELPYLNLCEMINDKAAKIKSFTYDFSNRYSLPLINQSVPKQIELPITLLRSTIFGQSNFDTINPLAFSPDSQFNSTNIFIPLKTNGKNLTICFPLAFEIKNHKLTFQLSY
jgi:hypothetical protein